MLSPIFISTYENFKSPPHREQLTWTDLIEKLRCVRWTACHIKDCSRSRCLHKPGQGWSPSIYPQGSHRYLASAEALSLFVADLDGLSEQRFTKIVTSLQDYQCIIHSSHSDWMPDDDRLIRDADAYPASFHYPSTTERCARVVIALSRPVLRDEWPMFWGAALAQLQIPADSSSRFASQFFYLPSRPKNATYYFKACHGKPLDVNALLEQSSRMQAPSAVASPDDTLHFQRLDQGNIALRVSVPWKWQGMASATSARWSTDGNTVEEELKFAFNVQEALAGIPPALPLPLDVWGTCVSLLVEEYMRACAVKRASDTALPLGKSV